MGQRLNLMSELTQLSCDVSVECGVALGGGVESGLKLQDVGSEVTKLLDMHPWTNVNAVASSISAREARRSNDPPPDWAHLLMQASVQQGGGAVVDPSRRHHDARHVQAPRAAEPRYAQQAKAVSFSAQPPDRHSYAQKRTGRTPREIPWEWLVMNMS